MTFIVHNLGASARWVNLHMHCPIHTYGVLSLLHHPISQREKRGLPELVLLAQGYSLGFAVESVFRLQSECPAQGEWLGWSAETESVTCCTDRPAALQWDRATSLWGRGALGSCVRCCWALALLGRITRVRLSGYSLICEMG